jgi:hypothetical protein
MKWLSKMNVSSKAKLECKAGREKDWPVETDVDEG